MQPLRRTPIKKIIIIYGLIVAWLFMAPAWILAEAPPAAPEMAAPAIGNSTKSTQLQTTVAAGASALAKVVKVAGPASTVVDGAFRFNSALETENRYRGGELTSGSRNTAHAKNVAGLAGGLTGAWLGAKTGAITGAAVGAFIGPAGATAGSVVGGGAGGFSGYLGGESFGEKIVQGWDWIWK